MTKRKDTAELFPKQKAVSLDEQVEWAHERMVDAMRRASSNRDDRVLVAAAFARFDDYELMREARERARAKKERAERKEERRLHITQETT